MRVRRCAVLLLEPREVAGFELASLLSGGTGVSSAMQWFAYAPHLAAPVAVVASEVALLGALGPLDFVEQAALRAAHGDIAVERMLGAGLLLPEASAAGGHGSADDALRAQHWHPVSAVSHALSRWQGEDALRSMGEHGVDTAGGLLARYGPPPPAAPARGDGECIALPRTAPTDFDALLDARCTCRNFDAGRALPQAAFAQVLERAFAARGGVEAGPGFSVIKRTSPSGGALHPTEAFLIVRRVEGIANGLYHYRGVEHALQAMPWNGGDEALDTLARVAVAGQGYFADAHVLVVLAPRYARNFWKYRNHAKAYRVCVLDAGHLSQTLLLCAADAGLGAFVTAAINEVDIEHAFGLTGYIDGPLAVCGFGVRAETMTTAEFDPNRKAWPR